MESAGTLFFATPTSRTEYRISLSEDALNYPTESRKECEEDFNIIVDLLKDRYTLATNLHLRSVARKKKIKKI